MVAYFNLNEFYHRYINNNKWIQEKDPIPKIMIFTKVFLNNKNTQILELILFINLSLLIKIAVFVYKKSYKNSYYITKLETQKQKCINRMKNNNN